jgi:hypothetical protein
MDLNISKEGMSDFKIIQCLGRFGKILKCFNANLIFNRGMPKCFWNEFTTLYSTSVVKGKTL